MRLVSDLFIIWRHLVLDVANKGDSHLGGVISLQYIADEVSFNLHLYLVYVRTLRLYKVGSLVRMKGN